MSKSESAVAEPVALPGEAIAGVSDEPRFLIARGWRCMGNPADPCAWWLDPTKPFPREEYSRIPVFAKDQNGEEHVMRIRDAKGKVVACTQVLCSPPAVPLQRAEAVRLQVIRDLDALKLDADPEKAERHRAAALHREKLMREFHELQRLGLTDEANISKSGVSVPASPPKVSATL